MARPKGTSHLSDDAVWTILSSPELSDAELATAIGATESAVHCRRWLLRTRGWTCKVAYLPYQFCGKTVTVGRGNRFDRPYHRTCQPQGRQEVQRRIDRRRWEQAPEPWKEQVMDRGHSYVLGSQSESIPNATARGLRWTPTEEAVLVTKRNVPIRLLAAELGRTYFGVCQRIKILRSRGLID